MKSERDPYKLEHRDFRALCPSEHLRVEIALEGPDGCREMWITCNGFSISDSQSLLWSNTDVRDPCGGYVRSFCLPVIGFTFLACSGGTLRFEGWVNPQRAYTPFAFLEPGAEKRLLPKEETYERLVCDAALFHYSIGRKLHIYATATPREDDDG